MKTYIRQNNGFIPASDGSGDYVKVTEGKIKKGDLILDRSHFSSGVFEIKSISKYYAKTATALLYCNQIKEGKAEPKEYSNLHIGAWVFRKV